MHKLAARFLALFFASSMGVATAGPITDTVTVDGNEWAQADLFVGLSWNEMNAVCPAGNCMNGGMLGGNDMTGW